MPRGIKLREVQFDMVRELPPRRVGDGFGFAMKPNLVARADHGEIFRQGRLRKRHGQLRSVCEKAHLIGPDVNLRRRSSR
jgi:hypothetical protein